MSDEDTSLLLDRIAELTGRLARAEFALGADGAITADALPDAIAVVVAERDGLRAELADEKCNGQSTEGAYHDARAERDRLRAVVEQQSAVVGAVTRERDRLAMSLEEEQELHGETRAERDQMRAVVEAAHEVLAGLDWTTGGGKKLIPVTALLVLRDGLAVLDGSGVMGGGDG